MEPLTKNRPGVQYIMHCFFLLLLSFYVHNHVHLASFPDRFFFNRTKLKNTPSWRPSVILETTRPGNEANTHCHVLLCSE